MRLLITLAALLDTIRNKPNPLRRLPLGESGTAHVTQ